MKWHVVIELLGLALIPLSAAPPKVSVKASSKTSAKRKPAQTAHRKPAANSASAPSGSKTNSRAVPLRASSRAAAYRASRARLARASRYSHIAPAPSYQLHPDPERYQQIQQALSERGYFKGEVNGTWGDDSVDAMRRFQYDQKLDDDGKITSLSLIGLGLGARHDGISAAPPATAPAASTPSGGIAPAPPSVDPASTTAQASGDPSQARRPQ